MNTYTWQIESLDCTPDNKVVFCIHWRVKATSDKGVFIPLLDGSTKLVPFETEIYGAQNIENNEKNVFINYADLTKDTVVGWVQETMGIDAVTKLQEALDKQLDGLNAPTVVTLPLPWAI
jgi:hypothetical protein